VVFDRIAAFDLLFNVFRAVAAECALACVVELDVRGGSLFPFFGVPVGQLFDRCDFFVCDVIWHNEVEMREVCADV